MPVATARGLRDGVDTSDTATVARLITENAADAIFLLDGEGRTTFANPAAEQMFGWKADELEGLKLHDVLHHHRPDGQEFPMSECPLGHVFSTGKSLKLHEDIFFHRSGRQVAVACSNAAIVRDGTVAGGVLIARDITKQREAERQKQFLLDELNHRVKNMLAVVQAIAAQSLRGAEFDEVRQALSARLRALSEAQDILTDGAGVSASVETVMRRALRPFSVDTRVSLSGPSVTLAPRMVTALSMAVHELATNATKYGALSVEGGTVSVSWKISSDDGQERLTLVWREHDGPEVVPPTARGFGSSMIERMLSAEFNGSAALEFDSAGLICRLTAPLPPAN